MEREPDYSSTADFVTGTEDTRGRSEEQIAGRRPLDTPATAGFERPDSSAAFEPPRAAASGASGTAALSNAAREPRPVLFPGDEAERLRARWTDVQGAFVDEPRRAV